MSAQKHSLQTRDLSRFGISFIYIYDFVLIAFLIFSLYWVFAGKVLEMEPYKSPGEEWCINKLNVVTPHRLDVPKSRRSNVAMLQEKLNKPYLVKKL